MVWRAVLWLVGMVAIGVVGAVILNVIVPPMTTEAALHSCRTQMPRIKHSVVTRLERTCW